MMLVLGPDLTIQIAFLVFHQATGDFNPDELQKMRLYCWNLDPPLDIQLALVCANKIHFIEYVCFDRIVSHACSAVYYHAKVFDF